MIAALSHSQIPSADSQREDSRILLIPPTTKLKFHQISFFQFYRKTLLASHKHQKQERFESDNRQMHSIQSVIHTQL